MLWNVQNHNVKKKAFEIEVEIQELKRYVLLDPPRFYARPDLSRTLL